jgi:hypothetical protein
VRRSPIRLVRSRPRAPGAGDLFSDRRLRRARSLKLADGPAPASSLRRPLLDERRRNVRPLVVRPFGGLALEKPARALTMEKIRLLRRLHQAPAIVPMASTRWSLDRSRQRDVGCLRTPRFIYWRQRTPRQKVWTFPQRRYQSASCPRTSHHHCARTPRPRRCRHCR